MKKLFCILLAALMVLSLCACSNAGKKTDKQTFQGLHVGYGRTNIMPEGSVPLGGYGNTDTRMSNGFLDYLYGTCIAFTEGEETLLLFAVDAIRTQLDWVTPLREMITKETGVPGDHIMVSSSHTHSAPALESTQSSIQNDYKTLYLNKLTEAAKEAMADRKPATLYATSTETEGLNFIRHYLLNDGTYAGDNFGNFNSGIKDYATETDPEMQLVKIDREGDAKDILMMNWQAHPSLTGGSTEYVISADFVGACRTKFEADTGMLFAYFQGAAGNQNAVTRINADRNGLDWQGLGQKLSEYAVNALPNMTKLEGQGIEVAHVEYERESNRAGSDKLEQAEEVLALWKSSGNRETANALAYSYGINSVYEANAIVGRQDRPEKDTLFLDVTRVGGLSFVHAPYEMFSNQGMYIKENTPFDMTFVVTMSNDSKAYFPSKAAYEYGCYESYGALFTSGIAEESAEQFVTMLNELKK